MRGLITQSDCPVRAVITHGAHGHATNGGLELDQWVSAIMVVGGKGLAACTEVGIITHSALVANAVDVALGRLVLAKRAITENTIVDFMLTGSLANSIVDWNEAMVGVALRGIHNTLRAEIPIRARQALVTDTNDALITSIADSRMAELAARQAARCDEILQAEVTVRSEVESVTRVVAMLVSEEAAKAKVVVFAIIAAYKIALVCFCSLLVPRNDR